MCACVCVCVCGGGQVRGTDRGGAVWELEVGESVTNTDAAQITTGVPTRGQLLTNYGTHHVLQRQLKLHVGRHRTAPSCWAGIKRCDEMLTVVLTCCSSNLPGHHHAAPPCGPRVVIQC